jgi:hypothetical protein
MKVKLSPMEGTTQERAGEENHEGLQNMRFLVWPGCKYRAFKIHQLFWAE